MLQITIPAIEMFDEQKQEFVSTKEQTLCLEHSLVSLSKWESKWHKAFLSKEPKTNEETIDYIKCMTITQNVDPNIYLCLTRENIEQVNQYIEDPMTATWFSEESKRGGSGREQAGSQDPHRRRGKKNRQDPGWPDGGDRGRASRTVHPHAVKSLRYRNAAPSEC